jgi:hypothetical protein
MPKYLFIIYNEGDTSRITGTTVRNDSFEVDPDLYKETQSIDFFNTVSQLVKEGELRFNSNHSGELTVDDLKQTKFDALQLKKYSILQRGRLLINQRIDVVSLMGFAKFIILNNYMADAGFFITDENREEKYLEIINANDTALISKLEEYLEAKDTISQDLYWYSHFSTFKDAVESASSEEKVDFAFETFNSLFN